MSCCICVHCIRSTYCSSKAKQRLCTSSSEALRGIGKSLDVDRMLDQSNGEVGVGLMTSTIEHKGEATRCFAKGQFGKMMMIQNYNGTLKYSKLYGDKDLDSAYGEEVISVIVKEFQVYAVHFSNYVKDRNDRSYHSWIIPALFSPMYLYVIFAIRRVIGRHRLCDTQTKG